MNHRLACLLVLAAACGGSSAADWVPSDIDTDQTLDRLGQTGYARVCGAFSDYVHDQYRSNYLIQAACTANALETTADAVACGTAVDDCLDTLPPAVDAQLEQILDQAGCNSLDVFTPTGCAAKVSELTDCLDALGEELDRIQFSATCAAFGSPVPSDWWMIPLPSACSALQTSC